MRVEYDDSVYSLGEVIDDLDARLDRVERALEALASDPAQPHHSAGLALGILKGQE